jgi:hypothetical protein
MKSWVFSLIVLLAFLSPAAATASLEIGSTSAIAWNFEHPRWSVGLGLDLQWAVLRDEMTYTSDSTYYAQFADATVFIVQPAVTGRLFLGVDPKLRPFLVTRIQREVPVVSSEVKAIADEVRDLFGWWRVGLGAGIRSELSPRFSVGGDVIARTSLRSYRNQPANVDGAADFLVFLQWRP